MGGRAGERVREGLIAGIAALAGARLSVRRQPNGSSTGDWRRLLRPKKEPISARQWQLAAPRNDSRPLFSLFFPLNHFCSVALCNSGTIARRLSVWPAGFEAFMSVRAL